MGTIKKKLAENFATNFSKNNRWFTLGKSMNFAGNIADTKYFF